MSGCRRSFGRAYRLLAEGALRFPREPVLETGRVEVVSVVALELGDFVVIVEVLHAYDALLRLLYPLVPERPLLNCA